MTDEADKARKELWALETAAALFMAKQPTPPGIGREEMTYREALALYPHAFANPDVQQALLQELRNRRLSPWEEWARAEKEAALQALSDLGQEIESHGRMMTLEEFNAANREYRAEKQAREEALTKAIHLHRPGATVMVVFEKAGALLTIKVGNLAIRNFVDIRWMLDDVVMASHSALKKGQAFDVELDIRVDDARVSVSRRDLQAGRIPEEG